MNRLGRGAFFYTCVYLCGAENPVQGLKDVRPALGSTHFQNSPGSYIPDLLEGNEYWGEEKTGIMLVVVPWCLQAVGL